MKRYLQVFCCIILWFFIVPCSSRADWTIKADFEEGQIGSKASGLSGFTEAGSRTTYTNERAKTGKASAKMEWKRGSSGWGECHASFMFPQLLREGDELWARGYFYFQSPWSWHCAPRVKILRGVRVISSDNKHIGYLSVFSGPTGEIMLSNEVQSFEPGLGVNFSTDRWQSIEMYVRMSAVRPVFRIWKDGVLLTEDKLHKTLRSPSDKGDFAYIMTAWNGGVHQDQIEFLDSFVFTTKAPTCRDAHGNLMIGSVAE